MRHAERLRQARGLLSEKEPAAVLKVRLTVVLRRFGRGEPAASLRLGVLCKKLGEVFIHADIHKIPVVQPRALDRTVGNIDEISADVLEVFDYAALGHIHKPMKVGSEAFRYCGTPLACSVSEAEQEKGIIMVEMDAKGELKTTVLPLKPLHKVKVVKGTLEEVLKENCTDYVTVILTDKADLDVIDMQERIRLAFPNLLEIRRENQRKADYSRALQTEELLDPYELCCSFLKEINEEEKAILQDVLHTVQGVK